MVVWSLLIELLYSRCQKLEAALFCVMTNSFNLICSVFSVFEKANQ